MWAGPESCGRGKSGSDVGRVSVGLMWVWFASGGWGLSEVGRVSVGAMWAESE